MLINIIHVYLLTFFFVLGKPCSGHLHPDYVPTLFVFKNSIQEPSSRYLRAVNRATHPKQQPVRRNKKHQRTNVNRRGLNGDKQNMNENEGGMDGNEGGMDGNEGGMDGNEGGMDGNEGGMDGNEGGMDGNEGGMDGNEGGNDGNEGGMDRNEGGNDGNEGGMDRNEGGNDGNEGGMDGNEGGNDGNEGGMDGNEGGMDGNEGGMDGDEGGMDGDEGGMDGDEGGMDGNEGGMDGDEGGMDDRNEGGMDGNEVDDMNQQFWEQLEQKEIEIGELQIENEQLCIDIAELEDQNFSLKQETSSLNAMLDDTCTWQPSLNTVPYQKPGFTAASLKGDDKMVTFYTGLPSYTAFQGLFQLFEPLLSKDESKSRLLLVDELLLVLMKLRLAVPNDDLGYRFDVTPTAVSSIFHKWIDVMSVELKCLIYWPDPVTLKENLPDSFRKHYSKVKCIIDCFEIFIERPLNFEARAVTYSNYKKHNTVKCLIAITPTGSICFISNAWGGRVSDKEITQKCGFLNHIDIEDVVMADRGFNISDDLAQCSARLLIPAFTRGKSQLSKEEVERTRQLARVRIHVERVIGQMRKKYKILQNTLPINLIKCPSDNKKNNCTIDRILIVTAALTNLCLSVIPS